MEIKSIRIASRAGQEVRCKACRALLGVIDDSGLTIRRNDLQATFDGEFHASLICYRRECGTLNVVSLSPGPRRKPGGPGNTS